MAEQTYDTIIDNKYKIGDIIGKQLIATKDVVAHLDFHSSNKIQAYKTGSNLGTVINYYLEPGTNHIYWYFKDKNNRSYFILHNPLAMSLNAIDKQTTKTVSDYVTQAKTDAEIESKGTFAYYFERYGKVIVGSALFLGVAYIYIDSKKDNKK